MFKKVNKFIVACAVITCVGSSLGTSFKAHANYSPDYSNYVEFLTEQTKNQILTDTMKGTEGPDGIQGSALLYHYFGK